MGREHIEDWSHNASCAFDIVDGEFVVASADAADLPAFAPVSALLRRVHKAFGIDAIFVSEWAQGEPVVHVSRTDEGGDAEADLLHATYGRQLLEAGARRWAVKGEHVRYDAVPVVTADGLDHGTLCCRRIVAADWHDDEVQREALRRVARLIAAWFDEASLSLSDLVPLRGDSVMGALATQF
jgi:hypothetical protein